MTKTFDFVRSLLGFDSSDPVTTGDVATRSGFTSDDVSIPSSVSNDVEIKPVYDTIEPSIADIVDEVRYLDGLLERTPYTAEYTSEIHKKREHLFYKLTDEQICDVIQTIYEQEQENAGVLGLYSYLETSEPIIQLQTTTEFAHDIGDTDPTESMIDDIEEYRVTDHATTVEKHVDVVKESITDVVQKHLADRSRIAYRELSIDGEPEMLDSTEQLDDAISALWDTTVTPTDAVVNTDQPVEIEQFGGVQVRDDVTDVVDVPCIVSDSDIMGYEIVQRDIDIEANQEYGYQYTINWSGFFECVDTDAVAVPQ